jgi:pyrroline-5-carboxylate reductase
MLAKEQPGESLRSMIRNVCVLGGSTEKGLEDAGLQATVIKAVDASEASLAANRGVGGRSCRVGD